MTPCPYCTTPVDEAACRKCAVCHSLHHPECWGENEGCAIPLCAAGPRPSDPVLRPSVPPREALVVEVAEQPVVPPPSPPQLTPAEPHRPAVRITGRANGGNHMAAVLVVGICLVALTITLMLWAPGI